MIDATAAVDVEGLDRYIANLDRSVRSIMNVEVNRIAFDAQQRVDVKTGALLNTIGSEMVRDAPGDYEWAVFAGDMAGGGANGGPVDYAEWQEYHSGKPFMVPSAEAAFPRIVEQVQAAAENPRA